MEKNAPSPSDITQLPLFLAENVNLFIPGEKNRELVLRNLDLQIDPGALHVILGENGSGKSTLLRLIRGDLWPASGKVFWRDNGALSQSPISGHEITELVSPLQQENLRRFPKFMTFAQMLATSAAEKDRHGDPIQIGARVEELAREIGALDWLKIPVTDLSQGQLRLALICRSILRRPELFLLDEFQDGLDAEHREKVFSALARMTPQTTMVFTAHREDYLPDWPFIRMHIKNGRLSSCAPAKAKSPSPRKMALSIPPINGKTLLRLEKVSVYVDGKLALKDINWEMREGEHWRIDGANGAGKSTLLRLLAGDEFAAAGGKLSRFAPSLGRPPESLEEIRRSVRLVSELSQTNYDYPLSALELVCSGYDNSVGIYREIGEAEKDLAWSVIELLFAGEDIAKIAGTTIRRLSTGQLRRLYLARALMGNPDILLLDEPFCGLDDNSRLKFIERLDSLAESGWNNRQMRFVIVSHYGEDFPACINRRAIMENSTLR